MNIKIDITFNTACEDVKKRIEGSYAEKYSAFTAERRLGASEIFASSALHAIRVALSELREARKTNDANLLLAHIEQAITVLGCEDAKWQPNSQE